MNPIIRIVKWWLVRMDSHEQDIWLADRIDELIEMLILAKSGTTTASRQRRYTEAIKLCRRARELVVGPETARARGNE